MRKILSYLLIFTLISCSPTNFSMPTEVLISGTPTSLSGTTTVSITPIPTIFPIQRPLYKVIDDKNAGQLTVLHQWDVENIFSLTPNTSLWFSNSDEFIIPIDMTTDGFHIQSFRVDEFTPAWFIKTDDRRFTIDENDQVITYLARLHIFNKEGIEIKIPEATGNCDETIASHIASIPGTNLVITGHRSYGEITESYGTSRLLLWDKNANSCTELIKEFVGRLLSLSTSFDGRYISYSVAVSKIDTNGKLIPESIVRVYDLNLQKEVCELSGYSALFNRQNLLVVVDNPGPGIISLIMPSDCQTQLQFDDDIRIVALTFHPSGDLLAGESLDGIINIWNLKTGEKLYRIDLNTSINNSPFIDFSPDGRFLVATKDSKTSSNEKDKVILFGIPEK